MSSSLASQPLASRASQFYQLTKPRVVSLIVFTAVIGMFLAVPGMVPLPLLLFLIIFAWTPPHFWSLALYREREYAKVGIPMLPVTHGSKFTRQYILFYTILLAAVTVMPFATRMSGLIYLIGAVALNAGFIAYAWTLYRNYSDALARKTFGYSIQYLTVLFALLLVDHYRMVFSKALQAIFF